MMDLYEILGVARDATLDQIKKAYRSLAKQYHPDVGGDPEKFHAIALAADVLSDEGKRAKYDETGTIDGPEANPNADALAIIGQLVDGLVQQIIQSDGLEHTDLVADLVRQIDGQIKSVLEDRKQAERFEKKATALRKRFKAKTGPDYIGQMLETKLETCRVAIASAAAQLGRLERARKIVLDAEFTVEPRPAPVDPYQGLGGIQGSSFWKSSFGYNGT